MNRIPLTKGQWAIVDDSDFEELFRHNWHAVKRKHGYHAARRQEASEGGKFVYMHNVIMERIGIDHWDGNGLNNQRSNLRVATKAQNSYGFQTKREGCSSVYRGVRLHSHGKWTSQIQFQKKQIYIGRFISEVEAARAYDEKAKELYGEFAHLNFLEKPATFKSQ